MADDRSVAALLAESRASHLASHNSIHTGDGHWLPGDPAAATEAIKQARALRLAAAAKDPDRTDPAWQADRIPHATLIEFYDSYLEAHGGS